MPLRAAELIHDAALSLAGAADDPTDRDRYLAVSARVGGSGRVTTLVEMVEHEPGDDAARFRLAVLLMRALIWEPADAGSRLDSVHQARALIRYQRMVIERRLDELRRSRP